MPEASDILFVSLGSTPGLRAADDAFAGALRRAGAGVRVAVAQPPRRAQPTMVLTDLAWARAARRAADTALAERAPDAVVYSTTTAALFGPVRGAIRFDALSACNRPGRHGLWQRPAEARRLAAAPLLLPWDAASLQGLPAAARQVASVVVPVPVEPSGPTHGPRDITAITYAANPHKKGLDRVLAAFGATRRDDETLVIAGADAHLIGPVPAWATVTGRLDRDAYRALVRRARVFVCAARREDYGIAQLEALADGCRLVTTPSPGPYAALSIVRALDEPSIAEAGVALRDALRRAIDATDDKYSERARAALASFSRGAADTIVAQHVVPALLGHAGADLPDGLLDRRA